MLALKLQFLTSYSPPPPYISFNSIMQTIPSASASDLARAMRNERKIVLLPRRVTPMSSNNLTPEVIKDVTISGIRDSNSLEPANPIPSGLRLVTDTISECRVATNCP
ncbi:hypothetical protein ABKN59_003498 [Abortiporus biennis]